jgi:arginine N-succinyltransferase
VIGIPHPSGRAAMRMLENEGFAWENYVDIFDGGPTMTVRTENIRSIREAVDSEIVEIRENEETKVLAAHGTLGDFVTAYAYVAVVDGGVAIDPMGAALLGVGAGDTITHVARW